VVVVVFGKIYGLQRHYKSTTAATMGSVGEPKHEGILRWSVPDSKSSAAERSFYGPNANKAIAEHKIEIHDFRTDDSVVKGPEGLDVQGFTYIKHVSVIAGKPELDEDDNLEKVYIPEVEKLICEVTGAKRAVVNNVAFRRRTADLQKDPNHVLLKGSEIDQTVDQLSRDVAMSTYPPWIAEIWSFQEICGLTS
jgi:hypothetical protein